MAFDFLKTESEKQERRKNVSRFMTGFMDREKPDKKANPNLYRVTYSRKYCVGGDICTFINPERFVLNKGDGKADFIGSRSFEENGETKFEMIVEDPTMGDNGNTLRRAADSCPAGVIRVVRVKDGQLVAGH